MDNEKDFGVQQHLLSQNEDNDSQETNNPFQLQDKRRGLCSRVNFFNVSIFLLIIAYVPLVILYSSLYHRETESNSCVDRPPSDLFPCK